MATPPRANLSLPVRGGDDNVPTYSAIGVPGRLQVTPKCGRLMQVTVRSEELLQRE